MAFERLVDSSCALCTVRCAMYAGADVRGESSALSVNINIYYLKVLAGIKSKLISRSPQACELTIVVRGTVCGVKNRKGKENVANQP